METTATRKTRIVRSRISILSLLNEYNQSGLTIKAFCMQKDIASASFHNWIKKYSGPDALNQPGGFASLSIAPSAPGSALFAEVNGIRIYQPVPAAFLKELLA